MTSTGMPVTKRDFCRNLEIQITLFLRIDNATMNLKDLDWHYSLKANLPPGDFGRGGAKKDYNLLAL